MSHVFDSVVNSVIFVVQVNIWHESLAQIFRGEKSAENHLETVYLLGPHDHEPSCDYFLGLATTAAMADYSQEPNTPCMFNCFFLTKLAGALPHLIKIRNRVVD